MKPRKRLLCAVAALALSFALPHSQASAQGSSPSTASPASIRELDEQRLSILEIAEEFAAFEWQAGPENAHHGPDRNGTQVDTPDDSFHEEGWHSDGRVNRGMPYAWGGFTSIEEFRAGLAEGLFAGLVPKSERAGPSSQALGVDCSGFVARCWNLPSKQSTRSLGALCYPLDSYGELLPGDIANLFDGHVVLFKEWADEGRKILRVYEAGYLRVEENEYAAAELEQRGFKPMRYKPLDARWVPMPEGASAFSANGAGGTWSSSAEPSADALDQASNLLADTKPREWARYEVQDSSGLSGGYRRTVMAARVDSEHVETQTEAERDGQRLMTGAAWSVRADLAHALLDFIGVEEPLSEVSVVSSSLTLGTYELGRHRFPARRISLELAGKCVVRRQELPVTLRIECVQSDEVPLLGVLEADVESEVVWKLPEGESVSTRKRSFRLVEFG